MPTADVEKQLEKYKDNKMKKVSSAIPSQESLTISDSELTESGRAEVPAPGNARTASLDNQKDTFNKDSISQISTKNQGIIISFSGHKNPLSVGAKVTTTDGIKYNVKNIADDGIELISSDGKVM